MVAIACNVKPISAESRLTKRIGHPQLVRYAPKGNLKLQPWLSPSFCLKYFCQTIYAAKLWTLGLGFWTFAICANCRNLRLK
jgi:hypothetical protein